MSGKFEVGETTYLDPDHFPDMVPISEEEARAKAGPPGPALVVADVDHATGVITVESAEPAPTPPRKTVRFQLNIARDVADVSSRLMLAEVVANGVLDLRLAMMGDGLTDLKVVSAARTKRGIELVIEGKASP